MPTCFAARLARGRDTVHAGAFSIGRSCEQRALHRGSVSYKPTYSKATMSRRAEDQLDVGGATAVDRDNGRTADRAIRAHAHG